MPSRHLLTPRINNPLAKNDTLLKICLRYLKGISALIIVTISDFSPLLLLRGGY